MILVAIVLMIAANAFLSFGRVAVARIVAVVALIAAAAAAVAVAVDALAVDADVVAAVVALVAAYLAVLAAGFAAATTDESNKKVYIASMVFYVCMGVAEVAMYL